jgi:hypothetical protein
MNANAKPPTKESYCRKGKTVILQLLLLMLCLPAFAQTTISTTSVVTNTETVSTVTLNFQNTNTFPVIITDLAGIVSSYGDNTAQVWYKTSAISGAPGDISTTNGWTMSFSSNFYGIQNTTNTTTQPLLTGISLTIPANTTYGLAIVAMSGSIGLLRVGTTTGTVTQSGGGCNMVTGNNIGYAAAGVPPLAPTITPRGFIGRITFMPGSNCTGTPNVTAISGPAGACSNSPFNLTSSGYSMGPGIGYQWQYFNTTSSLWLDLPGATTTNYTSAGITTATQFRLKTTCSFTSTQSLSNVITVSISAGLAGGTYTINNNQPSTSTNFTTFNAAAAAMACGILGPITLNVAPGSGPYTEQAVFGSIPGTSAVNKIRLNGNGAILQSAAQASGNFAVLKLSGTDYMTVDSLTLRSLGATNGYGVSLTDTAIRDSITHCLVDMTSLTSTSAYTSCGIALSDDIATINYYGRSSKCFVGYNHITGSTEAGGPYFGIMDGWNGNSNFNILDTGNVIAYNEVENFSFYGIGVTSAVGTKVLYNNIHRTNKTGAQYFVGIRSWDNYYGTTTQQYNTDVEIVGNRIHNPSNISAANTFYGIQSYNNNGTNNTNGGTQKTLIANNVIYNVNMSGTSTLSNAIWGIVFWAGNNFNNTSGQTITKIFHNTVDFSEVIGGNNPTYGIYGYDYYWNNTSGNNDEVLVKNNLITIAAGSGGTKYGFFYNDYNTTGFTWNLTAQRNNYYINSSQPGTQYYGHYMNADYLSLASFQAAYPTLEAGSLTVNPQYTNPAAGDFTPLNYLLFANGTNVQADVPKDILGRVRSITPTPGAFEISNDAGVTALNAPLGTYCSSVKQVKVTIKNSGVTTINTVQVNWRLNGVLQTPVSYSSPLLPNATAVVTLGNGLFLPSAPVEIKAWTSMPNGQVDGIPFNDTLVTTSQSSTSVPVDLGPDEMICTGNTKTLDAGYPGSVYLWDNNVNTQTRTLSAAGTYYVRLTALDGCIGVDTFTLGLRPLPVVDLGPDREICLGSTTTFDAGHPGATYQWEDGSVQQTHTVDTAGNYEVQVTDQYGCMGIDNVNVGMKDIPMADGNNATHADSGTYTFYPINPLYTISYRWNFGDGSPEVTGYFVQHTYTTKGIYTVTLFLEGECTGLIVDQSRTVDVFSVYGGETGINEQQIDGDIGLYPNPAKDVITIENRSGGKMQQVVVYNVLGQMILRQKADSGNRHRLRVSGLANGLYTVRLETDKGFVNRKFEVLN